MRQQMFWGDYGNQPRSAAPPSIHHMAMAHQPSLPAPLAPPAWNSVPHPNASQSQGPRDYPTLGQRPLEGGVKPNAPKPQAEFRQWCTAQMNQLTGSQDMTLVDFLVSLGSAGEITEYIQLYLGTTSQIAAFTTEFIKRKQKLGSQAVAASNEFTGSGAAPPAPASGGSSQGWQPVKGKTADPKAEDEWETSTAKAKKKKKVDPSLLGFSVQSTPRNSGGLDFGES